MNPLLSCLLFLSILTARADVPLNPGFESGAAGWAFAEKSPMSTEAAHSGQAGLRVNDFVLKGAAGEGEAAPTPSPATLPARAKPPLIVIKTDDLRPINGGVHGLWTKMTDYLAARKVKASIGMNMDKMGEASQAYVEWVKEKQASGKIEFWFHGWDHAMHEVDGVKYNEFNKRSYEEQRKRFDDSQKIAKETFGFPFVTFGPPGGASNGSFDENTVRVMADEPDMKVWLYPQPLDKKGSDLAAAGKVTILDRVWAVNLESKVGQPDFQKFLEGYAKNPDREYFVLQGHPMSWGTAERFAEFAKIIDFLIGERAEFVTPSELAARMKKNL
jgi:peptidoglycan/xylan/chitin deacetylase (PgdA/CDA1 family)